MSATINDDDDDEHNVMSRRAVSGIAQIRNPKHMRVLYRIIMDKNPTLVSAMLSGIFQIMDSPDIQDTIHPSMIIEFKDALQAVLDCTVLRVKQGFFFMFLARCDSMKNYIVSDDIETNGCILKEDVDTTKAFLSNLDEIISDLPLASDKSAERFMHSVMLAYIGGRVVEVPDTQQQQHAHASAIDTSGHKASKAVVAAGRSEFKTSTQFTSTAEQQQANIRQQQHEAELVMETARKRQRT